MKTSIIVFLFVLLSTLAFAQENPNQSTIDSALGQSFATQANQVAPILAELEKNPSANAYWIAYARYRSGIFNLATGSEEAAASDIQDAIRRLQAIEDKTSEDHALLGNLIGFSITFNPGSAAKLSVDAAAEYRKALKKDKNNLRAYLGLGESDFHTPEAYGGGQRVEEYLLKAIELPEQTVANGPSWGKNRAYFILTSYYLRESKIDKAKMYCMQGLSKYPQDSQLNELKKSL